MGNDHNELLILYYVGNVHNELLILYHMGDEWSFKITVQILLKKQKVSLKIGVNVQKTLFKHNLQAI